MECRPLKLMLVCVGLSLSSCTPEQIDSFCILYNKVIVEKGDGRITAPPEVKKRLLANELLYREQCPKGT